MSRDFIPGAEPLLLEGNETGCLLIHGGGGGTTWDLKEFANNLHLKTGMTIWLPALAGYGTRPEDLYDVTFDDLLSDAYAGLDKLLTTCTKVFVVGHSLGGAISLVLASERKEVSGVVTWAAPFTVKNRLLSVLPILNRIPLLRRAIPKTHPAPVPRWLREQGWIGYEWIPTKVGVFTLEGLRRLKDALNKITCPVLVIQGSEDEMVEEDSAQRIFDGVHSDRKGLHIVKGANHPIMSQDEFKNDLFNRTIEFLDEIST